MPVKIHLPGLSANNRNLPELLTEAEAADILGITMTQLRQLRYEKRGPKMAKVGPVRMFEREELLDWLRTHTR